MSTTTFDQHGSSRHSLAGQIVVLRPCHSASLSAMQPGLDGDGESASSGTELLPLG
jgi:hypothetical protein